MRNEKIQCTSSNWCGINVNADNEEQARDIAENMTFNLVDSLKIKSMK